MTTLLEKLLAEAEGQRAVAMSFLDGFNAFARGYESLNKAILLAAQKEGITEINTPTSDDEISEEVLGVLKEIKAPVTKKEKAQPQEEPEEIKAKAPSKRAVKTKLPTVAEISRAVSGVFTDLNKTAYAWAVLEMDKLYDSYNIIKPDELKDKPESLEFLAKITEIREQASLIEENQPKEPPKKASMTLEEYKKAVKAFADSGEEDKAAALLAAKEKFGVAKASQVAPEDYEAFVQFMEGQIDSEEF